MQTITGSTHNPYENAIRLDDPYAHARQPMPVYEPMAGPDLNGGPKSQERLRPLSGLGQFDERIDIDWSTSLRGAYVTGDVDNHFETVLGGAASAGMETRRSTHALSGDVGIALFGDDDVRFSSGDASYQGTYALSRSTALAGGLRLGISQDAPSVGYSREALILDGGAQLGVTRSAGRMQVSLNGSADRTQFGDAETDDGIVFDNGWRNHTGFGADGRAQLGLSSVLYGYVAGDVRREIYDGVSPGDGLSYDNWTYNAQLGLGAEWGNGLTAEVWGGYGWRLFDDAIPDVDSALYGASLAYLLPQDIEAQLSYDSAIENAGVTTEASTVVSHTLGLELRRAVNSWLTARASGAVSWVDYINSAETNNGYSVGAGLDLAVSRNMSMVADYAFDTDEEDGDSHTISAGVNWSR